MQNEQLADSGENRREVVGEREGRTSALKQNRTERRIRTGDEKKSRDGGLARRVDTRGGKTLLHQKGKSEKDEKPGK